MILAADIGGTHARLAAIATAGNSSRTLHIQSYDEYRVGDFTSLDLLFDRFLASVDQAVSGLAIATAGTVSGGTVRAVNLPWDVDTDILQRRFGRDRVLVVNDFAAMAYALQYIASEEFRVIHRGPPNIGVDPVLVLGAGTGLGASVLQWEGGRPVVLATEAGQGILGPTTEGQNAVWQLMQQAAEQPLRVEDVLSGPGLFRLYQAVAWLHDTPACLDGPPAVTHAALKQSDPLACEALEYFCSFLGSLCAQLTLQYGSWGGVVVAGGIVPNLLDFLRGSSFLDRYQTHPTMAAALRAVPISVTQHGAHAALGVAHWFFDEQRRSSGSNPSKERMS